MIVLMNGSMPTVLAYKDRVPFGCLLTPLGGLGVKTAEASGLPIGVDNGYYTKQDPEAFRRLLKRISDKTNYLFVACPDIVGNAVATLKLFDEWEPEIRSHGLPVALIGQDGLQDIPKNVKKKYLNRCDAFFVGGTDNFKYIYNAPAVELIREAKRLGKWVHCGRVNSISRINYCDRIGVDSVDGSGLVKSSREKIHRLVGYFSRRSELLPLLENKRDD